MSNRRIWTPDALATLRSALKAHGNNWREILKALPQFTMEQIRRKIGKSKRDGTGLSMQPDGKEAKHECQLKGPRQKNRSLRLDKAEDWVFTFDVGAGCLDDCEFTAWFCFDDGDWTIQGDSDAVLPRWDAENVVSFDCYAHAKKFIAEAEDRDFHLVIYAGGHEQLSTDDYWLSSVEAAVDEFKRKKKEKSERLRQAVLARWEKRRQQQEDSDADFGVADAEDVGEHKGAGSGSDAALRKRKDPPAASKDAVLPPPLKRARTEADEIIQTARKQTQEAAATVEQRRQELKKTMAETDAKRQDLTKTVAARIMGSLNNMTPETMGAMAEEARQQVLLLKRRDEETQLKLSQTEQELAKDRQKIKAQALERLAQMLDKEVLAPS